MSVTRWLGPSEAHDRLCKNGGATLAFGVGELPTTGFLVATKATEHVQRTVTVDCISAYVTVNFPELLQPNRYLGLWQSPESDDGGKVYFDVSRRFESYSEAMDYASCQHQKAIYDLATESVIDVPEWWQGVCKPTVHSH